MKMKFLIALMCIPCVLLCLTACSEQYDPASNVSSSTSTAYSETLDSSTTSESQQTTTTNEELNILKPTVTKSTNKTNTQPTSNQTTTTRPVSTYNPYKNIDKQKGKTIKMLVWWSLSDAEKKIIQKFTDTYGIKVQLISTTLANYQTKLASLITSRSSPDLCATLAEYFPMAVIRNRINPIDLNYWDLKNDIDLDFALMKQFSWKDKYYGVNVKGSWFSEKAIVFYNKSMFENARMKTPYEMYLAGNWNWDTLWDTAKKLTNSSKDIYGWADRSYNRINWLLSNDTDFVTLDNGTIKENMTNTKVVKSLSFISDMVASNCVLKESSISDFINGRVAMFAAGSSYMQKTNQIQMQMKSKWGVAPFPSPKGQKTVYANEGTVWSFPVGAKNVAAANYFIRYFLDPVNQPEEVFANSECKKVFNDIANSTSIRTCFSKGVVSFNSADDFYAILRIGLIDKNNVPIQLQANVNKVNAAIQAINTEMTGD